MIVQFADTKVLEGRNGIQRDLDRLERWAQVNLLKFSKVKCKALHGGQDKSKLKYQLESRPEEKYLEVFM